VIEVVPRISSGSQRDFRRVVSPELPTAHAIDLYVIVERYDSNDKNQGPTGPLFDLIHLDSLIGTSSAACEASNISCIIYLVHAPVKGLLYELFLSDSPTRTTSTACKRSNIDFTTTFAHTGFVRQT
jgi:hypothetical protein